MASTGLEERDITVWAQSYLTYQDVCLENSRETTSQCARNPTVRKKISFLWHLIGICNNKYLSMQSYVLNIQVSELIFEFIALVLKEFCNKLESWALFRKVEFLKGKFLHQINAHGILRKSLVFVWLKEFLL